MRTVIAASIAMVVASAVAACSSSNHAPAADAGSPSAACAVGSDYNPHIDPADFSTTIDNPFYPLKLGTRYTFVASDGNIGQTVVTSETKTILGVTCVVVHDYATSPDGVLLEDTFDYFAQDRAGNVWYFGEDTNAYSGQAISPSGSWQSGINCAKPGIVMKAGFQLGDTYRQEYLVGSAEDQATVLSVDETVTVPYGTFQHCLKTKDYTYLDPGNVENKFYCSGIGLVLTFDIVTVGDPPREALVALDGDPGAGAERHDAGAVADGNQE
jgi:hypothetical protein